MKNKHTLIDMLNAQEEAILLNQQEEVINQCTIQKGEDEPMPGQGLAFLLMSIDRDEEEQSPYAIDQEELGEDSTFNHW